MSPDKLHVRILAGNLDRNAGSSAYHAKLAEQLCRHGHTVSVIAFQDNQQLRPFCTIHRLEPPGSKTPFLWRFAPLIDLLAIDHQVRRLPLDQPDIVIAGEHLSMKAHYRRFPTAPWIYLPHSLLIRREIENMNWPPFRRRGAILLYEYLQKWALQNASAVVRFSSAGASRLRQHYKIAREFRCCINPPGPTLSISAHQKPSQRHNQRVYLLSVGALRPPKRITFAVQALAGLKCDADWEYHIIGDGPERDAIQSLVQERGLEGRIFLHGHIESAEELSEWYKKSDLLLFPSRLESFGLVLCEAMAHAVPALAMSAKAGAEVCTEAIISHGSDGYLASSDADFVAKLRDSIVHKDSLKVMGRRARMKMAKQFTWARHLECYEQLFEDVLAGSD